MLNQGDRAVSDVAILLQNPSVWQGSGLLVAPSLTENESGRIGIVEPQKTFTYKQRHIVNERNNGVELMSSIDDFRFKIVGVRLESDKDWIWAKTASTQPKIVYRENAEYTEEARQNKIQGTVALSATFGAGGKIECVGVVRGLPYGLTDQAIAASRAIRFEPAMIDGKPAPVQGNLEFTCNLH